MLLLDTCTLLWLVIQQDSLSEKARQEIRKAADSLFISAISAFEIGVKVNKKSLAFPMPAQEWFNHACHLHGLIELSIDSEIALYATQLPPIHKDPCDRLIIATAHKHHLTILTPDAHISAYSQVKNVEEERKKFTEKIGIIQQLKKNQSGPVQLLDEISKALPLGVNVASITESSNNVNIEGEAFTNEDIVRFVDNLKASGLLSGVTLLETSQAKHEGIDVYKYKLQFVYKG